jgi:predicted metal-dependent hydrolase
MQKMVVQNGEVFVYTIKRVPRSRGIKIVVSHNGNVEVIVQQKFADHAIESFVIANALWILRSIKRQIDNPRVILHNNTEDDWSNYKHKAYALTSKRLEHFTQYYGLSWNSLSIKKTKSRWGSCSSKGNLTFNYKIIFLPLEIADYIIVHELCHLREMNHGPDFWRLVEKTIPNHHELRKRLKLFI